MELFQLAIGPIQLLFILPGLYMVIAAIVVVFRKRQQQNVDHHLFFIIGLYLLALSPAGILMALYLSNKKKITNNIKSFKYSHRMREHGDLMLVLSIFCTIVILTTNN